MAEYLTTQQAADELGVSRRRVAQLISEGRLATVRLGRDHLIEPAALELVRVRKEGMAGRGLADYQRARAKVSKSPEGS